MRTGFRLRFRGFDRNEVVAVLAKLSSENEEAARQIDRLGSEIGRLQAELGDRVDNERQANRALVAASKAADDILERAEEDARRIVREAEERGEAAMQSLREQADSIEGQIEALLARRREVAASIESFIKAVSTELERARVNHAIESTGDGLAPTAEAIGLYRS